MPPWQMPWPLSMSPRTVMDRRALPGAMESRRMSSACAARSRDHMAAATVSARVWGASASCVMERFSRVDGGLQGDAGAVPLAVAATQMIQYCADRTGADAVAPVQRPQRIIHAQPHGKVEIGSAADALVDRVGGFVDQHGDGAHHHHAGCIPDGGDFEARRLEQANGFPACRLGALP